MQTILLEESGWNLWEYLGQHYGTALLQFAEKIVAALLVFWIGWKIVNWVMKAVHLSLIHIYNRAFWKFPADGLVESPYRVRGRPLRPLIFSKSRHAPDWWPWQ